MPSTPFHLGPALLIAALFYRWIDLPTVLVASVIIDIHTGLAMLGVVSGPVHGVATTFAGATVAALLVAGGIWLFRDTVTAFTPSRLQQERTPMRVLLAAFAGTYSHVFLDAMLYAEVLPFMPLPGNPFLGLLSLPVVYAVTAAAGLIAIPVLWWRVNRSG